jgi:hypothetical protein
MFPNRQRIEIAGSLIPVRSIDSGKALTIAIWHEAGFSDATASEASIQQNRFMQQYKFLN